MILPPALLMKNKRREDFVFNRDTTDEIDIANIKLKMGEKANEEVLNEGVEVFKVVVDINFDR